jgi:serine/threonine protein kinase
MRQHTDSVEYQRHSDCLCCCSSRALVYLHTRTPLIVHRDVKPLNVLLDRAHESCKLTDFGISRFAQTLLPKVRAWRDALKLLAHVF